MAGTGKLKLPPNNFDVYQLAIDTIPATALVRVSRRIENEPYFGRRGINRFDDPRGLFGTCYCGFDLTVAFAETVLHDAHPRPTGFTVPTQEVESRLVVEFESARKLRLARMYGSDLLRLGANGELSGTPRYRVPQCWSAALQAHREQIDGFIYMSRRITSSMAVVVFERPETPRFMRVRQATALHHHRDFAKALAELHVTLR